VKYKVAHLTLQKETHMLIFKLQFINIKFTETPTWSSRTT